VRCQALLRETLGLFGASAASRSQTLTLFGLFQTATCANNPVHLPYAHDDVTSLLATSWVIWGQHSTTNWVNPPRPGSAKVPLMEHPLLLWCKTSVKHCPVSAPLMGSQQPSDGLFSPMEVRTNHLPMCTGINGTCPSGMVLHIKNYALHGLSSHRDHSNVNHISSLILSNICIKTLIYHSIAAKTLQKPTIQGREKG
jgi:hypothetical protein